MVTIEAGKIFLNAWNRKNNKKYTAKDFFENEYYPLVLDHPKYIYWVQNSPFVHLKRGINVINLTSEDRLKFLSNFNEKINKGHRDASILIGMSASEEHGYQTTSGQVTNIDIKFTVEDVYFSWIGSIFNLTIDNGHFILLLDEQILLDLYEGLKVYRKLLNDDSVNLLAYKVPNWNGQWLNYMYNDFDYKEDPDFGDLTSCGFFKEEYKKGVFIGLNIEIVNWTSLYFNLSEKLDRDQILGYVNYMFKTNKTIGFIPFHLNKGRCLLDSYKQLYGEFPSIKEKKDYERVFGSSFGKSCEFGSIGLSALEPSSLDKFLTLEIKKTNKIPDINFKTYKTWLIMMAETDEKELAYINNIAKELITIGNNSKKNQKERIIEEDLLAKSTRKELFYKQLESLLNQCTPEEVERINDLNLIGFIYKLDYCKFSLYMSLLKIQYVINKKLQTINK